LHCHNRRETGKARREISYDLKRPGSVAPRQMTTVNRKRPEVASIGGEGRVRRADALPRGGEAAGRSGLAVRDKARRIPSDRRSDEEWCRAVVAKQA